MSAERMLRYATHTGGNSAADHLSVTPDEFAEMLTSQWGQTTYLESYQGDWWLVPFFDHDYKFESEEDALANGPAWYERCKAAVLSLFEGFLPDPPRMTFCSRPGRWVNGRRGGASFKLSLRTYLPDHLMRPMDVKSLIVARCSSQDIDDLFDKSIYTANQASHLLYAPGTRKGDTHLVLSPVSLDGGRPVDIAQPFEPGFLKDYLVQSTQDDKVKVVLPHDIAADANAMSRMRGVSGATTHRRFEQRQKAATTEQEGDAMKAMEKVAPAYTFKTTSGASACFQKQPGVPGVCPYGETHVSNNTVYVHFRPDGHMEAYCCEEGCKEEFEKRPKLLGRWKEQHSFSAPLEREVGWCNDELRAAKAIVAAYGPCLRFYDGQLYVYRRDQGLWNSDAKLANAHLLMLSNSLEELKDVPPNGIRQALQNVPSLIYSDFFLNDCDTASLNLLHYSNGMLDLNTFELLPHDAKYGCFVSTKRHFLNREEVEVKHPGAIDKARRILFEDPYTPNSDDATAVQGGIFAGKEVGKRIGQALTGVRERDFVWLVGVRSAAKGTTYHALDQAFGGYVASVKPAVYFANKEDPAAPSPQLARLRPKRIWWTPEMKTTYTLDGNFMKTIASKTDKLETRHLHAPTEEWSPQGKPFICGQDVNRFEPVEEALTERAHVQEMKVSFLHPSDPNYSPNNEWVKLRDDNTEDWLSSEEGIHGVTHTLFDMLRLRRSEGYISRTSNDAEKREWLGQHDIIDAGFGADGVLAISGDENDKLPFRSIKAILVQFNGDKPIGMSDKAVGNRLKRMGLRKDEHSKYSKVKKRVVEQDCDF